jgi:hypothetical protein
MSEHIVLTFPENKFIENKCPDHLEISKNI